MLLGIKQDLSNLTWWISRGGSCFYESWANGLPQENYEDKKCLVVKIIQQDCLSCILW